MLTPTKCHLQAGKQRGKTRSEWRPLKIELARRQHGSSRCRPIRHQRERLTLSPKLRRGSLFRPLKRITPLIWNQTLSSYCLSSTNNAHATIVLWVTVPWTRPSTILCKWSNLNFKNPFSSHRTWSRAWLEPTIQTPIVKQRMQIYSQKLWTKQENLMSWDSDWTMQS